MSETRDRHLPSVDEYAEWNARELGRHPVSRRSALRAVTAGVGGLALAQFKLADAAFAAGGGTAGSAGVVVSGRHLSFIPGGDGLPQPGMAVTAQLVSQTGSLPSTLRAWVEVGSTPGDYGTTFEAEITHLTGQYAIPGGPVGSQFYAKATLTPLRAGQLFHYRVRLSDGTVSGDAHFSTAPAVVLNSRTVAKPFTFTAFGDVGTHWAPIDPKYAWRQDPTTVREAGGLWPNGTFDNRHYAVDDPVAGPSGTDPKPAVTQVNLMATQKPVFTLLAGDICYADPNGNGLPANNTLALTGGSPSGTDRYNPYVWDVFLNQIEPLAAYTPWLFATGNHDMEPLYGNTRRLGDSPTHGYGGHLERLDMPENGPAGCPSVYRFVYGNVGVISLDANELSNEIRANTGYSKGGQKAWLEQTLKQWRSKAYASTIDFIVVFFHHCAYSTTHSHASDGGVRDVVDPLFSKYQVDLAIQGHNHVFERSDPIKYGKRTRPAPDGATVWPRADGVIYVTAGSGGRPRGGFRGAPSDRSPAAPGADPSGPQLLREGQRYRGYRPKGGWNVSENNTTEVANSYVWAGDGSKQPEAIAWSQVRYDKYAFIAVDVDPAPLGEKTTMRIRTIADAVPGSGQPWSEIDRVTLARISGTGAVTG